MDENGISEDHSFSRSKLFWAATTVKLKKTEKGSDWKKYEKRLKEIIVDGRKQDTNYIRSIIAKAMTNANIKVKDDAFKSTFNQYLQISVFKRAIAVHHLKILTVPWEYNEIVENKSLLLGTEKWRGCEPWKRNDLLLG